MTRPLEGLRVLDFTHVLAGPFATRILEDMGADVVKISSIERAVGANDPVHPYYLMWNRNKRSVAMDMSDDEARLTCQSLALEADIVIDNFSVGVLDRWGVGYDEISQSNEGVVYVQMSGMGDGGPWSKFVTYAPTIHALAGLTHLTGIDGREDIGIGFSYNDHQAGMHGAVAILAALDARHRTGRGQRIDISQFEVGANFVAPSLLDYFTNGHPARPCGNDLPYDDVAPHGCYPTRANGAGTAGEGWIAIACMTDAQWQNLKSVMGHPDWASAVEFDQASGRVNARSEIDARIGAWSQDQDRYELMATCQAAGVPAGVVQSGVDLAERDPQLGDFLFAFDDVHPDLGPTSGDRLPFRFSKTPCERYTRVRALGEDNESVLRDWLGMSDAEIQDKTDRGWLQS